MVRPARIWGIGAAAALAAALTGTGAVGAGPWGGSTRQGAAPGPAAGEPAAWIDTPLDGALVEPVPLEVVAHATDAGGVTAIEFTVDAVAAAPAEGLSGTLAHASFTVEVLTEGSHVLVAHGRGPGGRSTSAPITIRVARSPDTTTTTSTTTTSTTTTTVAPTTTVATTGPPTTPPPTAPPPPTTPPPTTPPPTTLPATTAPPTTAPCELVAPVPTSPVGSAAVNGSSITFTWDYRAPCDPGGFAVEVTQDRTFATVAARGTAGGGDRSLLLSFPCATGTWVWRVAATSAAGPGPWSAAGVFNVAVCRGG